MKTTKNTIENHNAITSAGAPAPLTSSRFWNDWAANNPTAMTLALRKVDLTKDSGLLNPTGILGRCCQEVQS